MNNQLDNLFKTKLEEYEEAPTAEAWQKLNGQLTEKRYKKYAAWLGVAASVVILIISGLFFIINPTPLHTEVQIAQNSNVIEPNKKTLEPSEELQTENVIDKATIITEQSNVLNPSDKEKQAKETPSEESMTRIFEQNDNNTSNHTEQQSIPIQEIDDIELITLNDQKEPSKSEPDKSSVKIVYNLEPAIKVDSSVFSEATQQPVQKQKVFDKIVSFAKNVKSSEVNLEQLRAVKDNILSFNNIKNDNKNQTQNK